MTRDPSHRRPDAAGPPSDMPPARIRPYAPEDADALLAIWEAANALAHPFLPPAFVDEVREAVRSVFLPRAEVRVVELSGPSAGFPAGFIALVGDEIGGLFLDPAHRRRGLGRALVAEAAARHGPLRVEVFRDNALGAPFYARLGFATVGEYLHAPSGAVTLRMAMPGAAPF